MDKNVARFLEFKATGGSNDFGNVWNVFFCGAFIEKVTVPWESVQEDMERDWLDEQYIRKAHNVVRLLWGMANGVER